MRIVHLTDSDAGGAGRAALRLNSGLRRAGIQSTVFVRRRETDEAGVEELAFPRGVAGRLWRSLRRVDINLDNRGAGRALGGTSEPYHDDRSQYGRQVVESLPGADIIHLHWVSGLVDQPSFFPAVPARVPVVWTLHDMNPFTGGCHYDRLCGRYVERCGKCPQLACGSENDRSRRSWERKHRALSAVAGNRLQIAAPSRWIAAEAERSALLSRFPIRVMPYGLDTDVFKPRPREMAREVLGLPVQGDIVLFVAGDVSSPRKGFDLLVSAMQAVCRRRDVLTVSVGMVASPLGAGVPHRFLGRYDTDGLLSLVYSAADLLVVPSRQDNLPNTVLEAMACGTPAVGFDIGGIPDMIRPGVTGVLAPGRDAASLTEAILQVLQNQPLRERLSANCRRIALDEYSLMRQANAYMELYEALLCK